MLAAKCTIIAALGCTLSQRGLIISAYTWRKEKKSLDLIKISYSSPFPLHSKPSPA